MDEVIKLKAKSEAEVQEMIKNTLHLKDNEAVEIKVLKSPKKILFLNFIFPISIFPPLILGNK